MAHASPAPTQRNRKTELPITPVTLSAKGEKAIRFASTVAVLAVFIAALILSWNGLTHLAIGAGFDESYAWLMPIAIDGMVVAGGLNVLHASLTRQSTKFGWFLTILGAGVSIWGNMTAFGDTGFSTESVVHGIAPASMALALEALLRILRGRIHATQAEVERQKAEEAERLAEAEKNRIAEEKRLERERRAEERKQQKAQEKKSPEQSSSPAVVSAPVSPEPRAEDKEAASEATTAQSTEGQEAKKTPETSAVTAEPTSRPQAQAATTSISVEQESKSEPSISSTQQEELTVDFDSADPLAEMVKIVDGLPNDTSDTDKALAIIGSFPKPSSADLALALGKGDTADDKRSAYKALERARSKQKKLAKVDAG